MQQCVLMLLAFLSVHGAPTENLPQSSCKDVTTVFVAGEAINKINQDRTTGYAFCLERVSNVHQTHHGETGVVFYLTIDILESKYHVLGKKSSKECESKDVDENPVYGQCKAVMYVNKPHSVSRLYKYSCTVRPVSASKISNLCPDCPILISTDNKEVEKTMKMGLEKFNNESGQPNYFAPLNITRALTGHELFRIYIVEFTIQETICSNKTDISEVSKCDLMTCEFAHKGFCKTTHSISSTEEFLQSDCEIYEPQVAEEEKKNHMQAGEMDHHKDTDCASHSHTDEHDQKHEGKQDHDHGHPHTKAKGHAHSHEHSHDHVHAHHEQAHNHTQDNGVYPAHHNYGHTEGQTHEHDHELALDHEHKHGHLHKHEHHHHHHHHHQGHETEKIPKGTVQVLPPSDKPAILPPFPNQDEKPTTSVGFSLHPDPEIPGQMEPVIGSFPNTLSPNCPAEFLTTSDLIKNGFAEDPVFQFSPSA